MGFERPHTPPMEVSDEANKHQLELACNQGDAYVKALKEMNKEAHSAGETHIGPYIVAYATEHAEGMYAFDNGELQWK